MLRGKKILGIFRLVGITLIFAVFAGALVLIVLGTQEDQSADFSGFSEIIDGDSLRMNGRNVRLVGIDAPELRQTCVLNGKNWQCGNAARDALVSKVSNKELSCVSTGRDKYRRTLAKCVLGDVDIGQWMVINGWALRYGDYELDEAYAQQRSKGIWQSEFERPEDWRRKAGVAEQNFDPIGQLLNLLGW